MTAPLFTVLVPTHDHSELIPFTLRSIQAQTLVDFELFVVGDGAPPATRDAVAQLARDDPRIRYYENRKGEGHGELYRHEALQQASASLVCYCGDDDLWLPHHLEVLARGLQTADFVHTLQTEINTEGHVFAHPSDLSRVAQRDRMTREMFNTFGPTVAGHTMTAYHRLPHGWRPRPDGMWSDLHMWRQFFATQGLTFATIPRVTSVKFAARSRKGWTAQRRLAGKGSLDGKELPVLLKLVLQRLKGAPRLDACDQVPGLVEQHPVQAAQSQHHIHAARCVAQAHLGPGPPGDHVPALAGGKGQRL